MVVPTASTGVTTGAGRVDNRDGNAGGYLGRGDLAAKKTPLETAQGTARQDQNLESVD